MLTSEFVGRQKPSSETSRVGRSLVTLARRRAHAQAVTSPARGGLTAQLQSQQGEIADKLKAIQAQLLPATAESAAPAHPSLQQSPPLRVFAASNVAP